MTDFFNPGIAPTEGVVTVNFNRITGVIKAQNIQFKIGSSGTEMKIGKEKIKYLASSNERQEVIE